MGKQIENPDPLPPAPEPGSVVKVPMDRYGDYLSAYRLRQVKAYDDNGAIFVEVVAVEEQPRMGETAPQADQNPPTPTGAVPSKPQTKSLTVIISEMLEAADSNPGMAIRNELPGGLRLDILLKDNQTHLQLSRQGVSPSDIEWKTVLKYWPYPIAGLHYRLLIREGRRYLVASWPLQARLNISVAESNTRVAESNAMEY